MESFDPYRKWLGIPEQDQPPHHYRLLGIELFESDADVISNAVDGRMAQIKNFQAGKYSHHSQRILNELAAAKVCLLNVEKKAEYDRRLQARLKSAAAPDTAETAAPYGQYGTVSSVTKRKAKKSATPAWVVPAGIATAVLLLGGVLAVIVASNSRQTVADNTATKPAPGNAQSQTSPAKKSPDAEKPAVVQSHKPAPVVEAATQPAKSPELPAKQANAPTQPKVEELPVAEAATLPPSAVEVRKPEEPAKKTGEPAPKQAADSVPVADAKPKKAAVPSDIQQAKAEKQIREIFEKEFAAARSSKGKIELATKLFNQGTSTSDDSAARFVLWRLAAHTYAEVGDLTKAMETIDCLEGQYDVDGLGMKADLLNVATESVRTGQVDTAQLGIIVDVAVGMIDKAMESDDFEIAGKFMKLATTVGRRLKDTQINRELLARSRDLDRTKAKYAAIQKTLVVLADDPANADANQAAGRWYCFVKGNWEKGMPMLARGKDAALSSVARQDIAGPKDPKSQMDLGDAWWTLSEKEVPPSKAVVQARALRWYDEAMPKLTGMDKAKAEKRLKSAAGADVSSAGLSSGGGRVVVQSGNVALASNGATVQGPTMRPESLLDGNSTIFSSTDGYAWGKTPCEWIVTLDKVYRIRQVRFRLYDKDNRVANYILQVSSDGKKYVTVADRSRGEWRSWQVIEFPSRPTKTIKLIGLPPSGSDSGGLTVVELEAYCLPPGPPPK
jgi:hypothetical protein